MVRRRKIPVRKHHGIRDPLKQLEEKEKKLRGITNNPPDIRNDQKPSFKFRQFKQLVDDAKAGKGLKKFPNGIEDKPRPPKTGKRGNAKGKRGPETPEVDKFQYIKQLRNESDEMYMRRVNRITRDSLNEAKFEVKYGVKVIRNPNTGEITIEKKPPNEIDELLKKKRAEARQSKRKGNQRRGRERNTKTGKDSKPINPKLAKELIKQALNEEKEERLKEQQQDLIEYKRDTFTFGEVVHAPPNLTALPRKANKHETVPRPGRKMNLHLRSLLEKNSSLLENNDDKNPSNKALRKNSSKNTETLSPGKVTKKQLQGKRKYLPISTRNMLEVERQRMTDIYRTMKLQQQQLKSPQKSQ